MAGSRDAGSRFNTEDKLRVEIPEYNYREGERKTVLYPGAGWYIPSERRWESYDEHRELPRSTRRDATDFQREVDFVNFLKKRDIPDYKKITAYYPSKPPIVKWYAHERVPTTDIDIGCEDKQLRRPNWNGPGYYGYYEEILDRMRKGDCRRLARKGSVGYPYFTHQTYF